jgi:multiple sugar transport system substrate-binding protein
MDRRQFITTCAIGAASAAAVGMFPGLAGRVSAAAKYTLDFWTGESHPTNKKGWEMLVDNFVKENPKVGLEVKTSIVPYESFPAKMLAGSQAGTLPEGLNSTMWMESYLATKGYIQPLDDLIAAIGEDAFVEADLRAWRWKDHYLGVPLWSESLCIIYRKDWYEKKGLKEPKSWDELEKNVAALHEDTDGDGKVDRYGIALAGKRHLFAGEHLQALMVANGGKVWDEEGKLIFNTKENLETLKFFIHLAKNYSAPDVVNYSYGEVYDSMLTGKFAHALTFLHGGFYQAILKAPEIASSCWAFQIPPGPTTPTDQAWSVNTGYGITASLKDPDKRKAVLEFYKYLLQPENVGFWANCRALGQIPSVKATFDTPSFWEKHPLTGIALKDWKGLVELGRRLGEKGRQPFQYYKAWPWAQPAYASNILPDVVQNVLVKNMSPEESIKWGEKQFQQLMEQFKL